MKSAYVFVLSAIIISPVSGVFAQTNSAWSTSGNIGIGTTSPQVRLQVIDQLFVNLSSDPTGGLYYGGKTLGLIIGNYNSSPWPGTNGLYVGGPTNLVGKVGIGTTSPSAKLHTYLNGGGAVARFESTVNNDGQSYVYNNTANTISIWGAYDFAGSRYAYLGTESAHPFAFITGNAERMRINEFGNVGIGTPTPNNTLDVRSGGSSTAIGLLTSSQAADALRLMNADGSLRISNGTTANLLNLVAGNVGIGTTNPTQKLSVNGTIRAKEVIVETAGWSDYVFAENYNLQPLAEVEEHIKEHKHLPGIPSAKEVAEGGVGLGEMQAKLLAKIEELTLHQIEQEKEIRRLNDEVRQIPQLQAELAKLRK